MLGFISLLPHRQQLSAVQQLQGIALRNSNRQMGLLVSLLEQILTFVGFAGQRAVLLSQRHAVIWEVGFEMEALVQVRPRILFYWSGQKSFHSIPLPLTGLSPNGFAMPRSGRSAAEEL